MQLRLVVIVAVFVILGGALFYFTQPEPDTRPEHAPIAESPQAAPSPQAPETTEPVSVEPVTADQVSPGDLSSYRVYGHVVDGLTNAPLPGATIQVANPGSGLPDSARASENGAFELEVRPDQGRLLVRADGYAMTRVPLPAQLQGDMELNITLRPGTSIAGIVVEKGTETPIEGIKVSAVPADSTLASLRRERPEESPRRADDATDATGQFLLTGLEAGAYRVVVEAREAGYLFSSDMAEVLRMGEGESAEDLWFALERGATVTGTVRGPDGSPVANAAVKALPKDAINSILRGLETQDLEVFAQIETVSDESGEFELAGLSYDREYRLQGEAEGFAPSPSAAFEISRTQQRATVDLQLVVGSMVAGAVTLADGTPIDDLPLMLMPTPDSMLVGGFTGPIAANSDEGGAFSFAHVPEGTYTLMLRDRESYHLSDPHRVAVDGASLYDGIKLVAVARSEMPFSEGVITGLVLDINGRPAPGVMVSARPAFISRGVASIQTGSDGRFTLETPPGRRFDIIARADYGRAMLEAVPLGSDVVLELRPPARVSGIVIDAQNRPVPEAEVHLEWAAERTPEDPAEEMMLAMGAMMGPSDGVQRSETNGHFHFTDVEAGEYIVSAKHSSMGAGESYSFTVHEGQSLTNLQVRLEPGVIFAGRVQDAYGQPVSGAFVRLTPIGAGGETQQLMATFMPMGAGPNTISSASQRDGAFELHNVIPGEYLLEATHAQFAKTIERGLTIARGANVRNHLITMTEGGTARGRYAPGGRPEAGAMILVLGESGMQMATTAFDGSFQVDNLPGGEYMMFPMRFDATSPGDFLDLLNNGQVVDIGDGDMSDIDFGTPPVGGQPVRGQVDQEPGSITIVSLRRPGGPDPATINPMNMLQAMRAMRYQVAVGMTEPDGSFNLDSVPPGDYILDAVTLDASMVMNPDPSLLFNLDQFPRITENISVGNGPLDLNLQF